MPFMLRNNISMIYITFYFLFIYVSYKIEIQSQWLRIIFLNTIKIRELPRLICSTKQHNIQNYLQIHGSDNKNTVLNCALFNPINIECPFDAIYIFFF